MIYHGYILGNVADIGDVRTKWYDLYFNVTVDLEKQYIGDISAVSGIFRENDLDLLNTLCESSMGRTSYQI